MIWLLLLFACTGDTDTDTETVDTGTYVPDGQFCDPAQQIGSIGVERWGGESSSWSAVVYDKPNPWLSQPSLTSGACAFWEYDASACQGACDYPQVCGAEGECVDPQVARTGVTLTLTADGESETHQADENGVMWGSHDSATAFTFDLSWSGGHVVVSEPLHLRSGMVASVQASGTYEAPGALDVSWSGSEEGQVRTTIPMNHHAGVPTFTQCQAQASAGGFEVPAEMVDPLSVITGLEFQGLRHGDFAAVNTEAGCVQIAVASYVDGNVQYP